MRAGCSSRQQARGHKRAPKQPPCVAEQAEIATCKCCSRVWCFPAYRNKESACMYADCVAAAFSRPGENSSMHRRDFIKSTGTLVAGATFMPGALAAEQDAISTGSPVGPHHSPHESRLALQPHRRPGSHRARLQRRSLRPRRRSPTPTSSFPGTASQKRTTPSSPPIAATSNCPSPPWASASSSISKAS